MNLCGCGLSVLFLLQPVSLALAQQDEPATTDEPSSELAEAPEQADQGPAQPEVRTEYETLVLRALAAYEHGQLREALNLFRRAHNLWPTAKTERTIALCYYGLGDFPEAAQHLETALHGEELALSPEQREEVTSLLQNIFFERLGRLRLEVSPATADVYVDGVHPPRTREGLWLLRPGDHLVTADASGRLPTRRTIHVQAGEIAELRLALPALTASRAPAVEEPGTGEGSNALSVVGIGAMAAGGVGLAIAGYATYRAVSLLDDLRKDCPDSAQGMICASSPEDKVASYRQMRTLSMVGFYAGLPLAIVGSVLWLIDSDVFGEERINASVEEGGLQIKVRL